jgi:hypothetical protein
MIPRCRLTSGFIYRLTLSVMLEGTPGAAVNVKGS